MVAFTGVCLAHRAQIMRLHGAWPRRSRGTARGGARRHVVESIRGGRRVVRSGRGPSLARRIRGSRERVSQCEPQWARAAARPRAVALAQGRTPVAVAAIRRVTRTADDTARSDRSLPAYVEIMLAAGDVAAARGRVRRARRHRGATRHGDGHRDGRASARSDRACEQDAYAALGSLRPALARLASDRRAVSRREDARLDRARLLRARRRGRRNPRARRGMRRLRAARRDAGRHAGRGEPAACAREPRHVRTASLGASSRCCELLATGQTNKQIATALALSEKTVDRHVSNILAKLCVPIARRRDGIRVPASIALKHAIRRMGKITHAASRALGTFAEALPAHRAYRGRIASPTPRRQIYHEQRRAHCGSSTGTHRS